MVSPPPVTPREGIVAPSGFGFRLHSREPLQFARQGGGVEPLEIVVTPEPRRRPDIAPLADWRLVGADHEVHGALYQVDRGFEFWTTDAGAYRIDPEHGRIELPVNPDAIVREQRLWGIPTALCLMHRGDVPLHAAAVEIDGAAVVLAAPRRHGKTTLALAFHQHGYRVLSEDLACCRPAPVPMLLPGPALLRVRPDVYVGHPPSGTQVVASPPGRVYLALDEDRKGGSAPVPIQALVFLRESSDGISITQAAPATALPDLWALTLHLPTDGARARVFQQLTRLASAVPAWHLHRPVRLDSLAATVERIVELCRARVGRSVTSGQQRAGESPSGGTASQGRNLAANSA